MDILDRQEAERWVPEQMKPAASLEANVTKLKLAYVVASQEKAGLFGKGDTAEKNRRQQERRKPNPRWTDATEDASGLSLQEPSSAAEGRALWASLTHRVARSQSRLNGTNTHKMYIQGQE